MVHLTHDILGLDYVNVLSMDRKVRWAVSYRNFDYGTKIYNFENRKIFGLMQW